MSDRDRAYRILGLEGNATLDEIEEAYRDLTAVWHPDRFVDSPELRKKAEEKQAAVQRAHQILTEYHASRKLSSEDASAREERGIGRGPSILDDTLSERMGKSKKRLPLWIALFGLVAVAVVISFLSWSPVDVGSDTQPSQQERIVADTRAARSSGVGSRQDTVSTGEESSAAAQSERHELLEPSQPSNALPGPSAPAKEVEPPLRTVGPQRAVSPSVPTSKVEATPVPSIEKDVPAVEEPIKTESLQEGTKGEEPAISELAERSFQILRAKSELANQLVEGAFPEFAYRTWRAVERSPSEVYVDLVAEAISEGREVHFVWAVEVEAQSVKPMSQAARDLQTRGN